MSESTAVSFAPTRQSRADSKDILEYVHESNQSYALQQLTRAQAIVYFLPLVRELFSGAEAKTTIVFTMLHTLMTDSRVYWTRGELDEQFHWLKEKHRNYILQRLSAVGWLEFHRDRQTYMISDKGEALMRVLSRFTMGSELVDNEGAALAEIEFSLFLESEDIPDRLKFLRNRLHKHITRADSALQSESPYVILEIYQQLKSAHRWAEQTRETMEHLQADEDDNGVWSSIRDIHDHLSKLHSMISQMQLLLQDIQNKQIDIAQYGLSQLDYDFYLIQTPVGELAELMSRHLHKIPRPFFMIEADCFDEARTILSRERCDDNGIRGWEMDVTEPDCNAEKEPAFETERLVSDLTGIEREWQPLTEFVSTVSWEEAAYRFSILTLLADRKEIAELTEAGRLDPVIAMPVDVEFAESQEMVSVDCSGEVRTLTVGRVRRSRVGKG